MRRREVTQPSGQRGFAVLVMLLILIVGGAYFLVGKMSSQLGNRRDTEQKDAVALAKAKELLITWAVNNATMPGMFPYPDRENDPGIYDGFSDCPGAPPPTPGLLLGKIPIINSPCLGGTVVTGLDATDSAGEVLWYAVSRNLVATNTTAPVINPNLLNGSGFSWLRVIDAQGNVVSPRVAAVIIAPGKAWSDPTLGVNQNRAGAAGPTNFLDPFTVPSTGTTYSNADFDGNFDDGTPCPTSFCEDFVTGLPGGAFNDRLTFITIDELMPLIERRVAGEVRMRLKNYFFANNRYPFAAALGDQTGACVPNNMWGFVPLVAGTCLPAAPAPSLAAFPAWYQLPPAGSGWQNFMYYAVAPACMPPSVGCTNPAPLNTFLTVGTVANVRAVVISRGRPLNGTTCQPLPPPLSFVQAGAPSGNVCDYLDDTENTNGNLTYTAVGTALSNVFNDQSVIVAP